MVKLKITVVIVKSLSFISHSPIETGFYLEKGLKKQCGIILTDALLFVVLSMIKCLWRRKPKLFRNFRNNQNEN